MMTNDDAVDVDDIGVAREGALGARAPPQGREKTLLGQIYRR